MKQEDLRKGMFLCTGTVNPVCEDFGPLELVSWRTKVDKFCTNPNDWGGYLHKEHYIDRNTTILKFRNQSGKVFETSYWEDELFDGHWNPLTPLKATNLHDAQKEVFKMQASKKLDRELDFLKKYLKGHNEELKRWLYIVGGEDNKKISKKLTELSALLK